MRIELLSRLLVMGEFSFPFENKTKLAEREIRDCISFFEEQPHNKIKRERIGKIHGHNLEIGRLHGEKGYFWEIDGVRKVAGKDSLGAKEYSELVKRIHSITVPYLQYIEKKEKSKESLIKQGVFVIKGL